MRILFVNPPSPDGRIYIRDCSRSGRLSKERTIWPQTGLAMFAAMFPDDTVKIIDCIAEGITHRELYSLMEVYGPDWVVFNPISSTFTHDMIVAHYAKALKAKTVAISPHIKALKEESHERFPALDYSINYTGTTGEPEYALRHLIHADQVSARCFKDLPPARQDLLPLHKYNLPYIGRGYTFVITSRGCPWKCIYCRSAVANEGAVRFRSVDSVIGEIQQYGLKNVAFHSDTFTCRPGWVEQLCDKMPKGVRWICNSRVDTVNPVMLKQMKDAGCWLICYGIESGDNNVLKANRKEATVEQAKKAVQWTKEAGMQVWGYFMLGMFRDSVETMEKTIQLACELPIDIANFAISAPYPGTEWHKIVDCSGWLKDDRWEAYDQNYSAQVEQPTCSSGDVLRMQRKAYWRWYCSWKGLRFAFRAGNIMELIKIAKEHLHEESNTSC